MASTPHSPLVRSNLVQLSYSDIKDRRAHQGCQRCVVLLRVKAVLRCRNVTAVKILLSVRSGTLPSNAFIRLSVRTVVLIYPKPCTLFARIVVIVSWLPIWFDLATCITDRGRVLCWRSPSRVECGDCTAYTFVLMTLSPSLMATQFVMRLAILDAR